MWSADGRELFFRRGDELRIVDIELELKWSKPRTLFAGPFTTGYNTLPDYDVSPGGNASLWLREATCDPLKSLSC